MKNPFRMPSIRAARCAAELRGIAACRRRRRPSFFFFIFAKTSIAHYRSVYSALHIVTPEKLSCGSQKGNLISAILVFRCSNSKGTKFYTTIISLYTRARAQRAQGISDHIRSKLKDMRQARSLPFLVRRILISLLTGSGQI